MGVNNPLLRALRAQDKSGKFDCDAAVISYKTGFPVLDYYLGYKVNVYDDEDNIIDTYPSIGITAGSYALFVGKPSSSKTTTAVQIASNIVREFDCGTVLHFDIEQAMNYTRIQALSKFKMSEMDSKYVLKQGNTSIDEVYNSIMQIYFEKTKNPEAYLYNTGKMNEFGKEIRIFQPTVVILDSIAAISMHYNENDKNDIKTISELEGNTYANRLARDISQFFTKLLPRLRAANIILLAINQIKDKVDIGVVKSAAEFMYMKQNETTPGGWAPKFYAHIFLKFVAEGSSKFTEDDEGFGGFGVTVDILKSRTNQAGRSCHLIYDKVHGVDSIRSTLRFAKDYGLLNGNKNKSWLGDDKENSFSMVNVHQEFKERPELVRKMYDHVIPLLANQLSELAEDELEHEDAVMDY